jgi:hypothetical protein
MSSSKASILSIPLLVAGLIALPGCDRGPAPAVNFLYHQIGLCKGYDTPDGRITARANEAFAVFKIDALDNTKLNKLFNFEPSLIYIDQSTPEQKAGWMGNWDRHPVSVDPRFTKSLGVTGTSPVTVPKGGKLETNAIIMVPVTSNKPSSSANPNSYDLVYDAGEHERGQTAVSEGFLYTNTTPAGTPLQQVDDCKGLKL